MLVPSAIRAGIEPVVMDYFADWDVAQWRFEGRQVQSIRLNHFDEVRDHKWSSLADGTILGGGFEVDLDLVQRLASETNLLANGVPTIRRFQRMSQLLASVSRAGFDVPEMLSGCAPLDPANWLIKHEKGRGGFHVRRLQPSDMKRGVDKKTYCQKFVKGTTYSALFCSFCEEKPGRTKTNLVGITRQLNGVAWLLGSAFGYCGSIGPLHELLDSCRVQSRQGQNPTLRETLNQFGTKLGHSWGMQGIWGVDFILQQDDGRHRAHFVDVNPRIPASAELYDIETNILQLQLDAFQKTSVSAWDAPIPSCVEAKAIVFRARNDAPLVVDRSRFDWLTSQVRQDFFLQPIEGTTLADIPNLGTVIQPGHPILTIRIRCRRNQPVEGMQQRLMRQLRMETAKIRQFLAQSPGT